jgi:hypothetical protein
MIRDYMLHTKSGPVWDVLKLKNYVREASRSWIVASSFSVSPANVLTLELRPEQYSVLAQHFFACEGAPTVLHNEPGQVQYAWICQASALAGASIILTQNQKVRQMYTLTVKVTNENQSD